MRAEGVVLAVVLTLGPAVAAADVGVTGIQAVHRHGQTFVTWKDVAEGEAGAPFRYALYRADRPITPDNLAQAERCYRGVLHNSAKLYGSAFNRKDRLDPAKPYSGAYVQVRPVLPPPAEDPTACGGAIGRDGGGWNRRAGVRSRHGALVAGTGRNAVWPEGGNIRGVYVTGRSGNLRIRDLHARDLSSNGI